MRRSIFLLGILTLLSGCAQNTRYIEVACINLRPIMVSKKDKMTDGTITQIFTQNLVIERLCHYK